MKGFPFGIASNITIGKTDIGFLINEFAKPDFSQHLSPREQSRALRALPLAMGDRR
ncbi:conserved hypothetical protein [Mesorhizobium plurifarium]|uniref:Uncharacterized protein n=1 Tax=Mesorhizobium plurifarium TaxID=69974 RepID=A0A090F026_MESPL|nr:conserved hypothetical protein [Mesorhizobium plurifarium]